ncbi:hypothetical protein Tco_0759922 [Tanacetum coccineum]
MLSGIRGENVLLTLVNLVQHMTKTSLLKETSNTDLRVIWVSTYRGSTTMLLSDATDANLNDICGRDRVRNTLVIQWISGDVQNNQIDQNASHMASAPLFHRAVASLQHTLKKNLWVSDGYGMEVSEIEAKKGGYTSETGSKVKKALIAESVRDSLHYWYIRVKERSKTLRSVATKSTCPLGSTIDEGDEEITMASGTLSQSSLTGTLNNFRSGYLNICRIE